MSSTMALAKFDYKYVRRHHTFAQLFRTLFSVAPSKLNKIYSVESFRILSLRFIST